MAVTAAVDCLRGFDRARRRRASTSPRPPTRFREKQGAALIAKALDLRRDVRTADLARLAARGHRRAASARCDAVAAGSRAPRARGRERLPARRAALGALEAQARRRRGRVPRRRRGRDRDASRRRTRVADEILDVWRIEGDRFVHTWEDRFVIQEGYTPDAHRGGARAARAQSARSAGDFAKRRALRARRAQPRRRVRARSASTATAGRRTRSSAGSATPARRSRRCCSPHALESARPGDRILVAALRRRRARARASRSTDAPREARAAPRRGLAPRAAARGRELRPLPARAQPRRDGVRRPARDLGLSATIHFRERDEDIAFMRPALHELRPGPVPEPARLRAAASRRTTSSRVRLSDRAGRVVTYTFDFFFPTPEPPTIVTITEVDGARVHLQLANARPRR